MPDPTAPKPPDWDERYAVYGWAFGSEPNDFLRENAHFLPPAGRVLCLAEGEGRNAVHLARLGHEVTGVDLSSVGLAKAQRLATQFGMRLHTEVGDLATWQIVPGAWDGIVSIFAHVPLDVRLALHPRVVAGLKPGGVLLLEAYRPEQLGREGGGPKDDSKLMTLAQLREELAGLEFTIAREIEREVVEGRFHSGMAAVVQIVGRKPLR